MNLAKALLLAIAAIYLGVLGLLYLFQRSFVFHPDPARPQVPTAEIPGLTAVEVPTADGLSLLAWYRPAGTGQPTLLYFHGNGGSLTNRISRIRRFAETGWGLLFLEYRGFGGNPGLPSEQGFAADAQAAAAFLDGRGVASKQLVLYGESIGTGVAVRLATSRPAAAIILEAPYTSIVDIAQQRFWYAPVRLMLKDRFHLLQHLPDVHAPLLVILGERDRIVPPAMSHAVFDAANSPKQLWTAPEGGHHDLMFYGAADIAIRFVREFVPQS